MPGYVQHGGINVRRRRRASHRSSWSLQNLVEEWERGRRGERCKEVKAGSVGIVVRDPSKPPPKTKLVATNGKLEVQEEEVAVGPNGTEFVYNGGGFAGAGGVGVGDWGSVGRDGSCGEDEGS
ncbi:hypothetical protein HID58_095218 [Brassica napus]|uniref:Uncharacterized protein n=1 Tax=Brassica napus TaxID=3708 RepID=A0ABQ7X4F0_BRANA|nr:hypothetical protein HID58_095218 [Brassica napus]